MGVSRNQYGAQKAAALRRAASVYYQRLVRLRAPLVWADALAALRASDPLVDAIMLGPDDCLNKAFIVGVVNAYINKPGDVEEIIVRLPLHVLDMHGIKPRDQRISAKGYRYGAI